MDGVQVLGRLKEIRPSIKVIMLTGYPTHATVEEAMRLGANAYCLKPIDRSEIESKVSEVLGQETHIELVRYPDKAEVETVITSYSIHYTKLYEGRKMQDFLRC